MPCSDGGPSYSQIDESNKKLENYKEMLCSACRSLEKVNFDFGVNPMLDKWWAKHKKEDEAREARELKSKLEREQAVHIAVNKHVCDLTEDDKHLLKKFNLL